MKNRTGPIRRAITVELVILPSRRLTRCDALIGNPPYGDILARQRLGRSSLCHCASERVLVGQWPPMLSTLTIPKVPPSRKVPGGAMTPRARSVISVRHGGKPLREI